MRERLLACVLVRPRDTFASVVTSSVGRGIHVATHRPPGAAGPAQCARACCAPRAEEPAARSRWSYPREARPIAVSPSRIRSRPRRGILTSPTAVRTPSDRARKEPGTRLAPGPARSRRCAAPPFRFRAIGRGDTADNTRAYNTGGLTLGINTRCRGVCDRHCRRIDPSSAHHRPGRGSPRILCPKSRRSRSLPRHLLARDSTLARRGDSRTVTDHTGITGALAQVYRPSSPHGILRPDTSTISIFSVTWYAPAAANWSQRPRRRDQSPMRLRRMNVTRPTAPSASSAADMVKPLPVPISVGMPRALLLFSLFYRTTAALPDVKNDMDDDRGRLRSTLVVEPARNRTRSALSDMDARYVTTSLSTRKYPQRDPPYAGARQS